ncbi:class I SAM-dependent methyltransferase [Undibacterium sp. Ji22W]|uniref:class I SAM-dependent methyltransferase n=1 Tax=Undibacterium sp. Ji22W TaxID=3413038 RepID=UPI003BF0ECCD
MSNGQASIWVQRFLEEIPKSKGPVLDLACGAGRHTRLLLAAGYEVWAVDRDATSLVALEPLGATCFNIDLEQEGFKWPFAAEQFAGIIVTNYLHRPLMPGILQSLADQGVLIYETFATGNEKYGRPRNPDFLLQENELLKHFVCTETEGWHQQCLAFEHTYVNQIAEAIVQRICVRRLCE